MLGHQEGVVDFEVAYAQLATCTAGHHVRKSRVRRLLDMITDQRKIHSIGRRCCTVWVTLVVHPCINSFFTIHTILILPYPIQIPYPPSPFCTCACYIYYSKCTHVWPPDTLSVVIMALHCAQHQRRHDLRRYIDQALHSLLKQQAPDGSFHSNLHTTALALQVSLTTLPFSVSGSAYFACLHHTGI